MPSSDPFRRPFCPRAWRGGGYLGLPDGEAVWRRTEISGHVHASGLRELLRRAALPECELRYMGAPAWLLEPSCPEWVDGELATSLLGRVSWDAIYGDAGEAWCGPDKAPGSVPAMFARDRRECTRLGRAVVAEYFS